MLIPPATSRSSFGGVARVLLLCLERDRDELKREKEKERERERGDKKREARRRADVGRSRKEARKRAKTIINYSIILKVRFASCRPRATFLALHRATSLSPLSRGNADPEGVRRDATLSPSVFRSTRGRMSINVAPVINKWAAQRIAGVVSSRRGHYICQSANADFPRDFHDEKSIEKVQLQRLISLSMTLARTLRIREAAASLTLIDIWRY